mmetsp:Transcript_21101/g.33479  ORF Transcript_21101/g.33479 Transcript_21101/m.33479 type:complete len:80 (-) Transcript_21101:418-657(-)
MASYPLYSEASNCTGLPAQLIKGVRNRTHVTQHPKEVLTNGRTVCAAVGHGSGTVALEGIAATPGPQETQVAGQPENAT